ncbi:hypothetical protein TNCV_1293961 [Trichonephila clavipes]|nr:hypothetical protein TNCV_1293961 [Trichonephila clavipes]
MEPPHISVFLFGITWMQHVVNDRLAVEVQCIGLPDRQTIPVWIISSGGNEILGVRNTRKQRRGTCSTHQCSSREIRNTPEMLSNVRRSMKRRCEACITCGGRRSNTFDSSFSLFLYFFLYDYA